MTSILGRLPPRSQIIAVFGVVAIIFSTWTFIWLFWEIPSWTYFLTVGEILTVVAYSLATNFVESLLFLSTTLSLAVLLPRHWLRDLYAARGTGLSIAGLSYLMFLAGQFGNKHDFPTIPLRLWAILAIPVAIIVFVILCGRIAGLRRVMEWIADQATIFAYILAPLSIISIAVVVLRSILG